MPDGIDAELTVAGRDQVSRRSIYGPCARRQTACEKVVEGTERPLLIVGAVDAGSGDKRTDQPGGTARIQKSAGSI